MALFIHFPTWPTEGIISLSTSVFFFCSLSLILSRCFFGAQRVSEGSNSTFIFPCALRTVPGSTVGLTAQSLLIFPMVGLTSVSILCFQHSFISICHFPLCRERLLRRATPSLPWTETTAGSSTTLLRSMVWRAWATTVSLSATWWLLRSGEWSRTNTKGGATQVNGT